MPIPPTNTSPATAYDLTGLLPLTDTIDLTGLANPQKVWFKFTLNGEYALSTWIKEETSNFTSKIKYYLELPANPAVGILQQGNFGIVEFFIEQAIGVPKTGTVYISIENFYTFPGSPTATPTVPSDIKFASVPNIGIPAGSLIISNDSVGYPATFVGPDGTVAQIRSFVPNGESSAMLDSGISLWSESPDYTKLTLFNANFEEITNLTWLVRNSLRAPISSNRVDTFYIADDDKITTVSSTGVLGATVWTVPTVSQLYFIHPSMVNNDIIYVKTWDGICKFHKSTSILDAAFIPYELLSGATIYYEMYGFYGEEFVVMDDDTIAVLYSATFANPVKKGKIVHYNTSGSVISEMISDNEDVNRIGYGPSITAAVTKLGITTFTTFRTIIEWSYDIEFQSVFATWDIYGNVRYSLVTMHTTGTGYTINDVTVLPAKMFGVPESCPLTTTTVALPPYGGGSEPNISQLSIEMMTGLPDLSGIYFINPNKATKHDSYYNDNERKIPNPTIKTALLGE